MLQTSMDVNEESLVLLPRLYESRLAVSSISDNEI